MSDNLTKEANLAKFSMPVDLMINLRNLLGPENMEAFKNAVNDWYEANYDRLKFDTDATSNYAFSVESFAIGIVNKIPEYWKYLNKYLHDRNVIGAKFSDILDFPNPNPSPGDIYQTTLPNPKQCKVIDVGKWRNIRRKAHRCGATSVLHVIQTDDTICVLYTFDLFFDITSENKPSGITCIVDLEWFLENFKYVKDLNKQADILDHSYPNKNGIKPGQQYTIANIRSVIFTVVDVGSLVDMTKKHPSAIDHLFNKSIGEFRQQYPNDIVVYTVSSVPDNLFFSEDRNDHKGFLSSMKRISSLQTQTDILDTTPPENVPQLNVWYRRKNSPNSPLLQCVVYGKVVDIIYDYPYAIHTAEDISLIRALDEGLIENDTNVVVYVMKDSSVLYWKFQKDFLDMFEIVQKTAALHFADILDFDEPMYPPVGSLWHNPLADYMEGLVEVLHVGKLSDMIPKGYSLVRAKDNPSRPQTGYSGDVVLYRWKGTTDVFVLTKERFLEVFKPQGPTKTADILEFDNPPNPADSYGIQVGKKYKNKESGHIATVLDIGKAADLHSKYPFFNNVIFEIPTGDTFGIVYAFLDDRNRRFTKNRYCVSVNDFVAMFELPSVQSSHSNTLQKTSDILDPSHIFTVGSRVSIRSKSIGKRQWRMSGVIVSVIPPGSPAWRNLENTVFSDKDKLFLKEHPQTVYIVAQNMNYLGDLYVESDLEPYSIKQGSIVFSDILDAMPPPPQVGDYYRVKHGDGDNSAEYVKVHAVGNWKDIQQTKIWNPSDLPENYNGLVVVWDWYYHSGRIATTLDYFESYFIRAEDPATLRRHGSQVTFSDILDTTPPQDVIIVGRKYQEKHNQYAPGVMCMAHGPAKQIADEYPYALDKNGSDDLVASIEDGDVNGNEMVVIYGKNDGGFDYWMLEADFLYYYELMPPFTASLTTSAADPGFISTNNGQMTPEDIVDDLTYINYAFNRDISPTITPEQWAKLYGPSTDKMEHRYQQEIFDGTRPKYQKGKDGFGWDLREDWPHKKEGSIVFSDILDHPVPYSDNIFPGQVCVQGGVRLTIIDVGTFKDLKAKYPQAVDGGSAVSINLWKPLNKLYAVYTSNKVPNTLFFETTDNFTSGRFTLEKHAAFKFSDILEFDEPPIDTRHIEIGEEYQLIQNPDVIVTVIDYNSLQNAVMKYDNRLSDIRYFDTHMTMKVMSESILKNARLKSLPIVIFTSENGETWFLTRYMDNGFLNKFKPIKRETATRQKKQADILEFDKPTGNIFPGQKWYLNGRKSKVFTVIDVGSLQSMREKHPEAISGCYGDPIKSFTQDIPYKIVVYRVSYTPDKVFFREDKDGHGGFLDELTLTARASKLASSISFDYITKGETYETENYTKTGEQAEESQGQETGEENVNENPSPDPQTPQLNTIEYPTIDEIIETHNDLIQEYGGSPELFGTTRQKLEAAIGRMQSGMYDQEFYPSIIEKAAVLVHSIVTTHPFADGNKRTAFLAGVEFLHYNGYDLQHHDNHADLILAVAENKASYEDVLKWLQEHALELQNKHHRTIKRLSGMKFGDILDMPPPDYPIIGQMYKNKYFSDNVIKVIAYGKIRDMGAYSFYKYLGENTYLFNYLDSPKMQEKEVVIYTSPEYSTMGRGFVFMEPEDRDDIYYFKNYEPINTTHSSLKLSDILDTPPPKDMAIVGRSYRRNTTKELLKVLEKDTLRNYMAEYGVPNKHNLDENTIYVVFLDPHNDEYVTPEVVFLRDCTLVK